MAQFLLRTHKAPLLLVLSAYRLHVLRTKPSTDSQRCGQLALLTTAFPASPSSLLGFLVQTQPAQECPARALLGNPLPAGSGETAQPLPGFPHSGAVTPVAVNPKPWSFWKG